MALNITYAIQNTVVNSPTENRDKWYIELDETSKKTVENLEEIEGALINIDKVREGSK